MTELLPAPPPLSDVLQRLREGATLRKLLRAGEAERLLSGRSQVCGLATFADALAGLDAAATLAAVKPHWLHEAHGRPLWMLDLPLGPERTARAARLPLDRRPTDPLQAWLPRLRRDDGSPVGLYRGDGFCPGDARAPELILAGPTPIPAGATLWLRGDSDQRVATLGASGWALDPELPEAQAAPLRALLAPPRPAPLPPPEEDDSNALRFGPVLSASLRQQVLACAAPGAPWAFVEERFLRFNWILIEHTGPSLTLQHQGGAMLEVWLGKDERVDHARCIEGDEAHHRDRILGRWHREGRPLIEAPEAAELTFTQGDDEGPEGVLTLSIEPDGWASVEVRRQGTARAWSDRLPREAHARLMDCVRATGFPPVDAGAGLVRLELRADGRAVSATLPGAALCTSHPYAALLEELTSLRDQVTRGALRPRAARASMG